MECKWQQWKRWVFGKKIIRMWSCSNSLESEWQAIDVPLTNAGSNPWSSMEATAETLIHTHNSHTKQSSTEEGLHAHIHTIPICIHRGMRRRALKGHAETLIHDWGWEPYSNTSHMVHESLSDCWRTTTPVFSKTGRICAQISYAGIQMCSDLQIATVLPTSSYWMMK